MYIISKTRKGYKKIEDGSASKVVKVHERKWKVKDGSEERYERQRKDGKNSDEESEIDFIQPKLQTAFCL